MARKDRIENESAWLRLLFAITAAIVVSILGWLAQNAETTTDGLVALCLSAIIVAVVVLFGIVRLALTRLRKLENLP